MKKNKNTSKPNSTIALIMGFITVLLWASSYSFTKVALDFYTPEALGFLRYLFASSLLIVFAIIKKIKLPRLKDIPMFFISGLAGFALYVFAFNKGSATVTAATSSIIISTAPIITAILASFFYKEHIKRVAWLAILLEFIGIIIITLNEGAFSMNIGISWIIIAATSISVYNVWQRQLLKYYEPFEATTYSIFCGTILLFIFAKEGLSQLAAAPAWQVINAINLGVLPGAFAYIFWAMAISKTPKVTTVTNLMFLTPLLSSIISFVVIKELPTIITVIGGVIIIGSSILFQKLNIS